jgi:hypothetical protein
MIIYFKGREYNIEFPYNDWKIYLWKCDNFYFAINKGKCLFRAFKSGGALDQKPLENDGYWANDTAFYEPLQYKDVPSDILKKLKLNYDKI